MDFKRYTDCELEESYRTGVGGVVVMFVHELSRSECDDALSRAKFGRLACAKNNQPYVLPMNLAFDGGSYLYGFTTLGQKVEWMRSNPLVCFEIDEVRNHNDWSSVIVFGSYEELPDKPENETARREAHGFLKQRVMWWEPAYISQEHRASPHSLTPIYFRIKIESVTGHCASSDDSEAEIETPAQVAQVPHSETHRRSEWIRMVKAALVYFLIVFGAGSLLGPIRILFVVPRLGDRMAELLEMPVMLLVIILGANWIVRRFQLPVGFLYRLGAGVIAVLLGLLFEFGLVLIIRGLTLKEYFESRDQIAASAYYLTLLLFVAMPLLASRHMHIK